MIDNGNELSVRLRTSSKLVMILSISWAINLLYVMATLWGWSYCKSIGSWAQDPLHLMFISGGLAKVVLSIALLVSYNERATALAKEQEWQLRYGGRS